MSSLSRPLRAGLACAALAVASVIAATPPGAVAAPPPDAVAVTADESPAGDAPSAEPTDSSVTPTVGSDFVQLSATDWPAVDAKSYLKVKVTSGARWKAVSDAPWLTIRVKTGLSGRVFTATAATNKGDRRVGHITVQSGQASDVLTVTQSAVPTVSATPARWDKGPEAETATFTISNTTGRPWALGVIKPRSRWIRVVGQTADEVTLSVEANTSIKPRTGRVPILAGTRRGAIVVAQAGAVAAVPTQ